MKYWPSTSEYKGRYPNGIARRTNEYEVGISFIAYTSVPSFSWAGKTLDIARSVN